MSEAFTPELKEKQRQCAGCDDDFYNRPGNSINGTHCWMLPDAKVVTRWKLHWWTAPVVPGAYREVEVLSCYHQHGNFAYHTTLPDFAVDPHRLEKVGA